MADLFVGATGGPNEHGTSSPDIWFDADDNTWGTVLNGTSTTWDAGAEVTIDQIRIAWAYGGATSPGQGASGAFDIYGSNTSTAGPWTFVYEELADPAI